MKVKFLLITFLLLFSRGCDFYSTSLWFFDDPSGEINPFVSVLDFGWNGLLISNFIIMGLIIYTLYFSMFKYKMIRLTSRPDSVTDFVSQSYFNEKGKFWKVLYKMPRNRAILLGHLGYVLPRTIIFASFLATFHNFCQYYSAPFYNQWREWIGRPLFAIFTLIFLSVAGFAYLIWRKEFLITLKEFEQKVKPGKLEI